MRPDTLVLLDDSPDWLAVYQEILRDVIDPQDVQVRAFTDDRDAAAFVCASHRNILGYIQDLNRGPLEVIGRQGFIFLDAIVRLLTPRARVLVSSGGLGFPEMQNLFSIPHEIDVLLKYDFESGAFRERVAWLLEGGRADADFGASASSDETHLLERLTVPWQTVRQFIGRNPELLHQLPPRHFEHLVAELYRDHGWEVELTARTRDGGYDLIALKECRPQSLRILVEVKRYNPQHAVGVGIVRSLYGTRHLHHASQVVIATSSHVSRDAKTEFCAAIPHELSFVERDAILEWCRDAGGYPLGGFSNNP